MNEFIQFNPQIFNCLRHFCREHLPLCQINVKADLYIDYIGCERDLGARSRHSNQTTE
jgi:hypothetical protein